MADSMQHRDKDEMETLLDELEKQVRVGKMHFWVWRDLGKFLSKDPELGYEAPGFSQLTLRAHMDEAFPHMSKLFDKSSDVVKLSDLLERAKQNAGKFTRISPVQVRKQLLPEWREKIDQMQKDVEPVRVRRNKLLAHLDPEAISDFPAVAEESKITVDELEKLYDGVPPVGCSGPATNGCSGHRCNRLGHSRLSPGRCDVPANGLMKQKMMNRPDAMKEADQAVQEQKKKAMTEGKYMCCLKSSCAFCALKMGKCLWGMNAASDKPVCNECKGGWHAGNGAIPGKTVDQIKTMPRMGM